MDKNLSIITKKSKLDHIVNSIKAICATNPFTAVIASLINDYVPKSYDISLNNFIYDIKDSLERLENRIDTDAINKDEFAELFISCCSGVTKTNKRIKIRIFARMFTNIMLKEGDYEKISYSELDHLVRAGDF